MKVIIDDQPVELPGSNLSEIIGAARQHLESDGRIVVEVERNGDILQGDALAAALTQPVEDQTIHLISARPADLAVMVLEQVKAQLDEISEWQQHAVTGFQEDQPKEAFELIGQCVQGWLAIHEAVSNITDLVALDLAGIHTDSGSAVEYIQKLAEQLKTLKQLLTDQDVITLADVLAYEWPETIDNWYDLTIAIIEHIQSQ